MPRIQVTAGAAIFYPALYFFDSAGWFSALVPAVLAHEFGHVIALRCCGTRITELRLELAGLCMECTPLFNARQEALCAAAGPAAGMIWGIIAAQLPGNWAQMSAGLSLGLSAFNMLPILPLDGGRILLAITGQEKLTDWSGRITLGLLAILLLWLRQWHWLFGVAALYLCRIKA